MTLSNHLQVPASGNPKPSLEAAPTGSPHPHTPRGQRTIKSMTPTFSFGLSFLPSFHFNSPVHSGSPHKFFHSWKRKQDSFPTLLTPPSSSRVCSNRFLDSLKKDDDDLWQSLGGESNLTSLSSIYEEGNGKEFLTPRRLHRDPNQSPQSKNKDENNTDTKNLQNTDDINESSKEKKRSRDSTPDDKSSKLVPIKVDDKILEETIARSIKRRKMSSTSIVDSPNNSIASQIDSTIDSPVPKRKHSTSSSSAVFTSKTTPTPSSSAANELGDKVWNEELDEVLIKCFLKYRDFRNNHAGYNCTSMLKSTSQNKVLSRMVFNKSGVLRTSKQISSRLFRLAKSKKLDKAPRTLKNQKTPSENNENNENNDNETINDGLNDLDELIKTPFEHLILNSYSANTSHGGMDSIKTNEIIDHELDLLLSSPKNTQSLNMAFRLTPKDLKIAFNNATESHIFTQSKKMFQSSLTIPSFTKLHQYLPTGILENLKTNRIPVWLVDHNIHLDIYPPNVISSTPISPFNQYQSQDHKVFDITNGSFDSFMKLDAKITQKFDDLQLPSMLNWKMLTKVYSNRECTSLLVEHTDAVNGYNTFENDSFDLQVPFMRNFFTGYFNYLINGSSSEGKGLTMVQIMYNNYSDGFGEDMKFDNERSHIYGYFVHRFTFDGSNSSGSKFNIVDLVNVTEEENFKEYSLQQQQQNQQVHEDDNETVVADSSPYKVSPNQSITNGQTDSPLKLGGKQLRIDIPKATDTILQGPQTAPIYNADVVSKFNQNMLKQQESFRMQLQGKLTQQGSLPMNKSALQPPLMHSQSMNNITHFKTSNSSDNSPAMASKSVSMPGSQVQFHNISSSTPLRDTVNNAPIPMSNINQTNINLVPQFIPPAQQQLMVNLGNGFVPFNSLHPKLQEQYMLVQRQFEFQRQEQQKLYMSQSPNMMPQTFENDMTFMNNVSGYTMDQSSLGMNTIPAVPIGQLTNGQLANQVMMPQQSQPPIQVQPAPPVPIKENKENIRPKEIKFGPILEYDPSKDSKKVQQKVSKQNAGIHRFPINTPVSMYKPKKK